MKITSDQTQKILTGNQTFSQLGFSMLVTRLKGVYANNPSPTTLQTCSDELNIFIQKFGAIMEKDFSIISKL